MNFFSCLMKYSIITILLLSPFLRANKFASAALIIDSYNPESNKIKIGLLVNLQPGWHIYWKNPGDTGMPTKIEFSVPNGFGISDIKFPIPKAFEFDGLVSYGYEGVVVFIAEIFVPAKVEQSEQSFSVKLKSLICKDVCIPFDTMINFKINLNKDFTAPKEIAELFFKTNIQLPIFNPSINLKAELKSELLHLLLSGLPFNKDKINSVYFLPYENGYFLNSIHQKINWSENSIELIVEPDPFRTEIPNQVLGIVIFERDVDKIAYEIKISTSKNN